MHELNLVFPGIQESKTSEKTKDKKVRMKKAILSKKRALARVPFSIHSVANEP